MKQLRALIGYSTFFLCMIMVDFLSKQWALKTLVRTVTLNSYFSCELVINRGIAWGIFHHAKQPFFIALSISISLFIVLFVAYTVFKFLKNRAIYAEILILAGALGNLIDRVLYNGVVDFMMIHVGPFYSPVFNVADALIIVGVICILTVIPE